MFWESNSVILEDALLNDQLLFEVSPAESLINFELPTLDTDTAADWQLNDLDINCDSFVIGVSDLNKEETNQVDSPPSFDFEDLDSSILDEYLLEAFNSDISNDIPNSGTDSPCNGDSVYALETHDYLPLQKEWDNTPEESVTKVQTFGEPKFCPEQGAFRCPVEECGKLYAKASHVRAHLRRHSGEKPYRCTWGDCAWRFARSDELARHRRSHSGDKPYRCSECGKKFARSDHLAKHGRVHARRAAAAAAAARRSTQHSHRRSTRGILVL